MKTTHEQLRALAEAATPGPWFVRRFANSDGTVDIETGRIAQRKWRPAQNCEYGTAGYIAAVSPDVVLALLDELAASKEANRVALEALEQYLYSEDGITMHEVREAITQLKEVLK
jgi:hypothetical protein